MVMRKPIVITSNGTGELVSGDTLPTANTQIAGLLVPSAAATPEDMVSANATLLGLGLAVSSDAAMNKLNALYNGGKKGITILPSRSRMWQDTALATPATAAADPVRTVEDLSPNNANGVASAAGTRPTLRKSGGATWLENDGTDDDLYLPNAQFNQTAMTIIASVELRANGAFPYIISNTAAASGVYFGFNSGSRQPRISIAGGTAGAKSQVAAGAVALNTRITLTLTIDTTDAKIYQNGVLILTMPTGGDWGAGTQYRAFGANTPMNMYGLIIVEGVLSDADRAYYEGLVGTNDQGIAGYSLQKAIDAAVASVILSARSGLPYTLYALPSPYNLTGTTTETKISSDITVPANTLGNNSKIRTDALTSCTSTANAKYLIIRFGPNASNTDPIMLYFNFGGVLSQHIFDTLTCRNSSTDKIGFLSYTSSSIGTSSVSKSIAMQNISVDNTVINYITVWMKNGQTTDNATLQMLTLEVIP